MGRSRSSRATVEPEGGDEGSVGGADTVPAGAEERDAAANARPLKKRDSRHKGADAAGPEETPAEEVVENTNGTANGDNDTPPAADADADADADAESDTDEEYEVESILDSKKIKGKTHFLIRWKGYQPESDSWEPESTLSCPELIAKYKEKQANGKAETTGTKRKGRPKSVHNNKKQKVIKKVSPKKKNHREGTNENEEYEVEKIIEVHNKKNGNREFLIRWKGWTSNHDTWEPEKNLNCPNLIEKFMEKVSQKKNASLRDLRVAPKSTKRFTLASHSSGRRLSKRSNNRQRVRYDDAE